ncbi:MAG TPA: HD domain-containing phosphohydrolase [Fibrobacteraceae bacterium]|nr:HD domain-containing phosphohydrolase [Fibrobacteraceae bacterium]
MPEQDFISYAERTEIPEPRSRLTRAVEKIWSVLFQQTLLFALVLAIVLHLSLVLMVRLTGVNEPWFAFTVASAVRMIFLCGFFYLMFHLFFWLSHWKLLEADQKVAAISEQNLRIQQESVQGFAKISEARDLSTGQHIQRMKEYARIIAQSLSTMPKFRDSVTPAFVQDVYIAAPLHDIGKVGTKDEILRKRGKLSGEEFELMKMHTIVGGDLMAELEEKLPGTSFFSRGREIAYHHHQRWDGTGYPNILNLGKSVIYFVEPGVGHPLKGEEIPLSARIVALADVYDALRSRRVYKEPFTHEVARDMILQEKGKHFDPDVVDAFLAAEAEILQIAVNFKD